MSRLCPNGHEVKDNLRFCPICGAELQEKTMKFCKKCGNERKGTEKFCSKCGTPFESMESPRQTQQYSPSYAETEDTSNNQRYIIPIIIGVVILALIGGGWWYYNSSKTTDSKNDIAATDTIAADTVAAAVEDVAFADTIAPADTVACSDTEAIYEESYSSEDEVSHSDENTPSDDSNVCWFVFGTKKELERYNIIKGNSVNLNSIDNQYFSKIDKNESKVIKIYSKSAKILTSHPQNSYELVTDENGNYQLNIISPLEFWSRSKYLVVENE